MTTDNGWRYTAHVIERRGDLTNNRQRGNRGKAAPEVRPGIAEQSAEAETGATRSAGETGADEANHREARRMRTRETFDVIIDSTDGGHQLCLLDAELALHVDGEFIPKMLSHSTDAVMLPDDGIADLQSHYLYPMRGHQLDTEFGRTTKAQECAVWEALLRFAWGLGDDYGFAATWACVDALYIVATDEAHRNAEPVDVC